MIVSGVNGKSRDGRWVSVRFVPEYKIQRLRWVQIGNLGLIEIGIDPN